MTTTTKLLLQLRADVDHIWRKAIAAESIAGDAK